LRYSNRREIDSGQLLFTRQREALGLGQRGVVRNGIWFATSRSRYLLADDVVLAKKGCLAQMMEVYDKIGGNIVAVVDVPREQTNRYGILDIESDDGQNWRRFKGLVEKPEPAKAPSTLSIIGRYILQPEIFAELENQKDRRGRRDPAYR